MKKRRKKKKKILFILLILVSILLVLGGVGVNYYFKLENAKKIEIEREKLVEKISSYYSNYVITNKEINLYNEKEEIIGKIGSNVELVLEEQKIDYNTKYFTTKISDNVYYVRYQDVQKKDDLSKYNDRYKKYIVFNKNIVTKDKTSFYDKDGNLVYEFNQSFNLPIIIKETDKYGVEFYDRLLYITNNDVKEVIDNHNTDLSNTRGIPVLNYHFAYQEDESCGEIICHSEKQMTEHFSYIKDNGFFTPTMKELEMYIDGKIRLPKSVVITFDDGTLGHNARMYADKYQLNATLFVISSWFAYDQFASEYLEIHSHGHDLHNPGVCPGGQGGAIKCLDKDKLLADLKTSREKLGNTTYFCYPFYEYNNYSISVLKEAGYTMAFAGESSYSDNLVKVGSDKFRLPRFVVVSYTTMKNFTNYINVD